MKKWLEKMRNKSEVEKRSFALFASGLLTMMIALVYFLNFFSTNTVAKNENTVSPFATFKDMIVDVIENNNF